MKAKNFPVVATALATICSIAGCQMPATLDGRVVDELSGQPIAGAIVTSAWEKRAGLAHSSTICVHAESAVTNERGEFQLENWDHIRTPEELIGSSKAVPSLRAYKPGFMLSPNVQVHPTGKRTQMLFKLRPFTGTKDDHMLYLQQATVLCEYDPKGALLPLHDAVLEEARATAETAEQKVWADWTAEIARGSHETFRKLKQEARE